MGNRAQNPPGNLKPSTSSEYIPSNPGNSNDSTVASSGLPAYTSDNLPNTAPTSVGIAIIPH